MAADDLNNAFISSLPMDNESNIRMFDLVHFSRSDFYKKKKKRIDKKTGRKKCHRFVFDNVDASVHFKNSRS